MRNLKILRIDSLEVCGISSQSCSHAGVHFILAVEPNAQGCTYAHPLFESKTSELQILRTHFLGSYKENIALSCPL